MANYTQHCQLHQWEPEDHFLRTDFNTDFQKIDTELGEKSGIVFGTYSGNGNDSQEISLGFSPKAVLVVESSGLMGNTGGEWPIIYGGLALREMPVSTGRDKTALMLTDTGFTVYNHADFGYIRTNTADRVYGYLAVR